MAFMQPDDDDSDFLSVGGSSKLVNLFTEPVERSANLKYSAPKQPRASVSDPQTASVSMSTIYITVVHGFTFDGTKPIPQGKLGAAILGNHSFRQYKLLLYKGKQQPVAIAAISSKFTFTVVTNNYANFQDDQHNHWSVLFDSLSIMEEFSKQVGLARANCMPVSEATAPLVQLLVPGDGPELEPGDGVQILYTSYILAENTFGQTLETNQNASKPVKLRLGKGKFIKGLEDGLIGAKKNSKLLIVVPPFLGYGSQSVYAKVTAETVLLYEVFVVKTKSGRESQSPTPSLDYREPKSSSFSLPQFAQGLLNTLPNEALDQPREEPPSRADKASLIERMAKMGRPLFPGAIPPKPIDNTKAQSNTDSEDDISMTKTSPLLNAVRRHRTMSGGSTEPNETSHPVTKNPTEASSLPVSYHPASYPVPYMTQPAMMPHPYNPNMMAYPSYTPMPSSIEAHLPLLVTETRTQNTEVRILLGKLEDKIESLSKKIENKYEKSNSTLDPKLQYSIEKVLEESSRIQGSNALNLQTINSLNSRMQELIKMGSKEEFPADVDHTKLKALEAEKNELARQLKETVAKMIKYQEELEESRSQLSTIQMRFEKGKEAAEQNQVQEILNEASKEKLDLQNQIEQFKQAISRIANDKDLLERSLDNKNEQLERERKEAIDKMEEGAISHKKEMEELTMKLKQLNEGKSTLAQTEEELKAYWQDKLEQAVQQNKDLYEKNMHNLLEEKVELNLEIRRLQEQLKQPPANTDQTIKEVEDKWKLKLDLIEAEHNLYKIETKATIDRLTLEINDTNKVKSMSDLNTELKRLVNAVYRNLQNDIENDHSYLGVDILQLVLDTFRGVTLEYLASCTSKQSQEESDLQSNAEMEERSEDVENETTKDNVKEGDSSIKTSQPDDNSDFNNPINVENKEVESIPNETTAAADISKAPELPAQLKVEIKSSDSLTWKPQPPPPPLFDEDDDEDDWLK